METLEVILDYVQCYRTVDLTDAFIWIYFYGHRELYWLLTNLSFLASNPLPAHKKQFQKLLPQRNLKWWNILQKFCMKNDGPVALLVGNAHLYGRSGLLQLCRNAGDTIKVIKIGDREEDHQKFGEWDEAMQTDVTKHSNALLEMLEHLIPARKALRELELSEHPDEESCPLDLRLEIRWREFWKYASQGYKFGQNSKSKLAEPQDRHQDGAETWNPMASL